MEAVIKKYQQKFKKVKEEMSRWDGFQTHLLTQFTSASAIFQRLQLIQDPRNYVSLKCVKGIEDAVLAKQMESLQNVLDSMDKTMEDFYGIILSLKKISQDGDQLVQGSTNEKQRQQRYGIKPSISDCTNGLRVIWEMHNSEYLLKSSIVSALKELYFEQRSNECVRAFHQLLVDQPNIQKDEVQTIFNIIFAEEI